MCDFVSGIIREKDEEILIYDFWSHKETAEFFKLKGEMYREFEWTGEEESSLRVRIPDEHYKDENWYRSLILSKFKNRSELLKYFIPRTECGSLDLSGLTTLPEGIVFPAECGYLDLRGLTKK